MIPLGAPDSRSACHFSSCHLRRDCKLATIWRPSPAEEEGCFLFKGSESLSLATADFICPCHQQLRASTRGTMKPLGGTQTRVSTGKYSHLPSTSPPYLYWYSLGTRLKVDEYRKTSCRAPFSKPRITPRGMHNPTDDSKATTHIIDRNRTTYGAFDECSYQ